MSYEDIGFLYYQQKVSRELTNKNISTNMRNSHLEKSKRNQQIKKLLASGRTQAEVAREFNITVQRLNQLVQKWVWQGLLERNEEGFAMPSKVEHQQKLSTTNKKI